MTEERKVSIEFTEQEATQLVRILDFSVKQVGISDGGEVANNGIYFLNKINSAFADAPQGTVTENGAQ